MKIKFGTYEIEGKRGDFVVSETGIVKKGKTKGKEVVIDARYFGTLYQCFFYLLNAKLGEADKVDVRALADLINKHCKEIKELAGGIND